MTSLPSSRPITGAKLDELYQSVILDHNRRPRNHGELAGATARADGTNPSCGDEVTVWVRMDGDLIADVHFTGRGCAISRASASMMTAAVKGMTRGEAEMLFGRFHDLVTGARGTDATQLGALEAFSGVSRFPVRVKCASLSWHALRSALRDPSATSGVG
jgi:nitrogen fixation NifU-like protein